jgi:hypothetical protein
MELFLIVQDNLLTDNCDSTIRLHNVPELSQEKVFTPDLNYLPYLGWRMIGWLVGLGLAWDRAGGDT